MEAFQRFWCTPDVVVSYDPINIQWPGRKDAISNTPWPHRDQDTWSFRCMQGLVNIFPNGEYDGGLIVCPGAHKCADDFHRDVKDEPDRLWSWTNE